MHATCSRRVGWYVEVVFPEREDLSETWFLCWQHQRAALDWARHGQSIAPTIAPRITEYGWAVPGEYRPRRTERRWSATPPTDT